MPDKRDDEAPRRPLTLHLSSEEEDGQAIYPSAFKEIYKRHKVRLIIYISRYLGRHNAIAEDLFHDVWENLLKHREDYVPRAKFTNYLYTIARNVVFDYFRRNKVEVDYFRREKGVGALPERSDEAEPKALEGAAGPNC